MVYKKCSQYLLPMDLTFSLKTAVCGVQLDLLHHNQHVQVLQQLVFSLVPTNRIKKYKETKETVKYWMKSLQLIHNKVKLFTS